MAPGPQQIHELLTCLLLEASQIFLFYILVSASGIPELRRNHSFFFLLVCCRLQHGSPCLIPGTPVSWFFGGKCPCLIFIMAGSSLYPDDSSLAKMIRYYKVIGKLPAGLSIKSGEFVFSFGMALLMSNLICSSLGVKHLMLCYVCLLMEAAGKGSQLDYWCLWTNNP